jgi:hypothetical protein
MANYQKNGLTTYEEKELLKEARERMRRALDADKADRQRAQDELRFVWNKDNCQWSEEAKKLRTNRPMLTENRNPSFVRQATNEVRRSRPQIRVLPVDGKGDPYTAQIMEGLIRNIEANSRADLSYDGATDHAGYCGRGYWKVTTEYQDEGFDQDIVIAPVADAFSIVDDPDCSMPDKSDRKFAFEVEKVARAEYEAKTGYKASSFKDAQEVLGEDVSDWCDEKMIVIANYWRVTETSKRIYRMSDGQIVEDHKEYIKQAEEGIARLLAMPQDPMGPPPQIPQVPTVENERELVTRKVEWFCIDGMKAHSKGDFAGKYIPLVYTTCEQMKIDGKWETKGMTFDGQDLTKANNYLLSAQIENIALTPKQPFVGPKGAFDSDKAKWNQVNVAAYSYIEYDPVDAEGKMLPPPQRASGVTAQPEIANVRMGVIDGQRAVVGLMGASLGDSGAEVSGIAIDARKVEGDTAVFHVMDNLVRAVRYCGMVVVDLIPKVYDSNRVIRIINPDGEPMMMAIKQAFVDQKDNKTKLIDFSVGKYDITVSAGPAFETQRQSDNARLIDLTAKVPQLAQVAPDLLVKELLPGTNGDKISQRLHRTLDPSVTGEGPTPQVQQLQQQLQQLQQQMQDLGNQNAFLTSEAMKQKEAVQKAHVDGQSAVQKANAQAAINQAGVEKAHIELQKKELELMAARMPEQIRPQIIDGEVVKEGHPAYEPPPPQPHEVLAPAIEQLAQALQTLGQGQAQVAQALAEGHGQIAQAMAKVGGPRRVKLPSGVEIRSEAV